MNWQELYKKIAFLDKAIEESSDNTIDQKTDNDDKPVDEDTVEECGPMGTPGSQPDNVSMNVSLNGSGAGGIKDLMAVLRSIENGDNDHDHDEKMPLHTISLGDQAENEEFANQPNAEYQDINYMTKDIAGGLNDQHRQYKKEYPGDNPMAVKKLETKLGQMYEEFKTRT
jgi:hypothetical protein